MISPVPCSSAARRHRRYSSSEQAGVQSGGGYQPDPVIPAMPAGRQPLEARHHLVHRPGVAHGRGADLRSELGGQPGEEPLVRLVRVDVLIAADQAESRAQARVLVGAEGRLAAKVRQARPPVVHVDGPGLAALDRGDQPPQDAVVEVLLRDRADRALDVDVGLLEDVLVEPGPDGKFGMVVAVHEPGQHEVPGRTEDPVEGAHGRHRLPRPGGHDRGVLDDQAAVRDQGLGAE